MIPTIIAAVLDSSLPPLKPSDIAVGVVCFGVASFFLWAMFKASNVAAAQGEGMGCGFGIQAFVLIVFVLIVGVALVAVFQAGHPGQ